MNVYLIFFFDHFGMSMQVGLLFLQDFEKLKFISFGKCWSLVYMPDVSCIPNLEELNLSRCKNLKHVHNSVANHCKLRKLNLAYCFKLQRFPDILNENESLREVLLGWTSIEELPTSIGNLVSLEDISLFYCKKLVILPSSIYKLQNLKVLQLCGCSQLQEIPKIPRKLRRLKANNCKSLTRILSNICDTGDFDLEELEASNCQQLQEIPKIPRKLRRLKANNCKSLARIPSNICDIGDVDLYSSWDQELVRNGFPVNDLFMPEILGVAFCVVYQQEAKLSGSTEFEVIVSVNCKAAIHSRYFKFSDLDHVWLEYMELKDLWTVDHFGPNGLTHFRISIRVCNYHELLVKKCGFRLICKPLENDLEVLLQDDQLLDPALLYKVSHEDNPMSTKEKRFGMVDSSIEVSLSLSLSLSLLPMCVYMHVLIRCTLGACNAKL
ncbi:hypothetical protein EUGRSUZ_H01757 [Eucalyptus grandis]|uniref:Uncharacterized protein n=1 Tax=Eucalyptus grandis TaxID=71139 RepID=A0ACC3JPX2_EUCGR|nr:hypothetical protein EUGRSUZ_H01757 [Eucalyptus grandis]